MYYQDALLQNFRKEISLIRGKIYTFQIDTIDWDSSVHPFYFSTEENPSGWDGLITEGVSVSRELIYPDPGLGDMGGTRDQNDYFTHGPHFEWSGGS